MKAIDQLYIKITEQLKCKNKKYIFCGGPNTGKTQLAKKIYYYFNYETDDRLSHRNIFKAINLWTEYYDKLHNTNGISTMSHIQRLIGYNNNLLVIDGLGEQIENWYDTQYKPNKFIANVFENMFNNTPIPELSLIITTRLDPMLLKDYYNIKVQQYIHKYFEIVYFQNDSFLKCEQKDFKSRLHFIGANNEID